MPYGMNIHHHTCIQVVWPQEEEGGRECSGTKVFFFQVQTIGSILSAVDLNYLKIGTRHCAGD